MLRRIIPWYLVLLFLLFACGEEEAPNDEAFVTDIDLLGSNIDGLKLEKILIDTEEGIVQLLPNKTIPTSLDTLNLEVDIHISKGAVMSDTITNLKYGSFDDEVHFTITAETGDVKDWIIQLAGQQLPNAHFENWYEVVGRDSKLYWEPGKNKYTIWSTENYRSSISGIYGTIKFPEGDGTQIKMKTLASELMPIIAASVYTGSYSTDSVANASTNLDLAISLGTPFKFRPDSMRISYRYKPGEQLIKATPNITDSIEAGFSVEQLRGIDECFIYTALESRSGDAINEIGRAEFSSSKTLLRVFTITIPFTYVSSETPTHIIFYATSSKNGNKYQGAVGSSLNIDNLEYIYNE